MFIHLADASQDRGQYQILFDMGCANHLFAYPYKNAVLPYFERVWKMFVYLAGNKACESPEIITTQADSNTLMSFEDRRKLERKINIYRQVKNTLLPRILIDSGAFTAWNSGKYISVSDYGRWALDFKKQWEHQVKSLYFFNLDVIGDQSASNTNLHKLEKMGLSPIPIFTYKADIKELIYYLQHYPYIGLGGLVGLKPHDLDVWLAYCFKFVIGQYKASGILPKIHLLGVTKEPALIKYPCYSSDSSTWVGCLRFGRGNTIGKPKIPRYSESPEALAVTIATLRAEIKKYQEMETRVTKIWQARGVYWND